ncbi:hypothetical protein KN1_16440 [Stygiolobus caldivivus]|uniref:Uncharacterized protein n=1 Tax=Stygiolobus caldivivus TaxID=2824673 RepID=A0A8D5U6Y2_9CREN|nr:hypothetical protein KN1_16440 [Stygiolobus caldivivus]
MQQIVQQEESKTISQLMSKKKKREAEIIEAPKVVVD